MYSDREIGMNDMKKMTPALIVIAVIISAVAYFNSSPSEDIKNSGSSSNTTIQSTGQITNQSTGQITDSNLSEVINVKTEGISAGSYIYAEVERVVDGDTLKVRYKGQDYRVRLLDVDTPESVKQGVSVQAYSKEATAFTEKLCGQKTVKLVFEKDIEDKYGRLLAFVVLPDGQILNELLVEKGYARVQIISPNTSLKKFFYNLLKTAIEIKAGLWSLSESKRPFVADSDGEYIPVYY